MFGPPCNTHGLFVDVSRVENWRSDHWVLSPTPPRQTGQTVFPYTAFQSSSSRGFRFTWPSGIVSSGDPRITGVYSVAAISLPSLLRKHDEGIAPSLSQSYVVFEILAVI